MLYIPFIFFINISCFNLINSKLYSFANLEHINSLVIPKYKNTLIATIRAAEQSAQSLVKFVFQENSKFIILNYPIYDCKETSSSETFFFCVFWLFCVLWFFPTFTLICSFDFLCSRPFQALYQYSQLFRYVIFQYFLALLQYYVVFQSLLVLSTHLLICFPTLQKYFLFQFLYSKLFLIIIIPCLCKQNSNTLK